MNKFMKFVGVIGLVTIVGCGYNVSYPDQTCDSCMVTVDETFSKLPEFKNTVATIKQDGKVTNGEYETLLDTYTGVRTDSPFNNKFEEETWIELKSGD